MQDGNEPFGKDVGLFACAYQAIYNPDVNRVVRDEYDLVMAKFELPQHVREVGRKVSSSTSQSDYCELVGLLKSDTVNHYQEICSRMGRQNKMSKSPDVIPGSGVLAFMYNALYNDEVNQRIKESDEELEKVLSEFGLTDSPAIPAIKQIVESGEPNQEHVRTIAEAMESEMDSNSITLRQHIW